MKISQLAIAFAATLGFLAGSVISIPETRDILLENDRVIVRQVIMQPGVKGPEHTHDLPHVGVIIRGGVLEFHEKGTVEQVDFESGDAGWREAGVTHSIVNRSEHPVHVVEVELKN